MQTKTVDFSLEPHLPRTIRIEYDLKQPSGKLTALSIWAEGKLVGRVLTRDAIGDGISVNLTDQDVLFISVKRNRLSGDQIEVALNGYTLEKPPTTPEDIVNTAHSAMMFVAFISALVGVATIIFDVEIFQELDATASFISAIAFTALAYIVKQHNWLGFGALLAGLLFYVFDSIVFISAGVTGGVGGILTRILITVVLARGIPMSYHLARRNTPELNWFSLPKFEELPSVIVIVLFALLLSVFIPSMHRRYPRGPADALRLSVGARGDQFGRRAL
jgi:hypothetical protein